MSPPVHDYMLESLSALLVIVLMMFGLAYVSRRAGWRRPLGPVQLLARLPLEPRRSVYVVRVLDQILILGSSEAGLAKLGELPESALDALEPAQVEGWATWFGGALGRSLATAGREADATATGRAVSAEAPHGAVNDAPKMASKS